MAANVSKRKKEKSYSLRISNSRTHFLKILTKTKLKIYQTIADHFVTAGEEQGATRDFKDGKKVKHDLKTITYPKCLCDQDEKWPKSTF